MYAALAGLGHIAGALSNAFAPTALSVARRPGAGPVQSAAGSAQRRRTPYLVRVAGRRVRPALAHQWHLFRQRRRRIHTANFRSRTHKRQRSFYKAAIRLGDVCDSKQEHQRTEEKQETSCSKLGLEKAAPSWIAIWHRLGVSGRDRQAQKPSAQGVCEREHARGQDK